MAKMTEEIQALHKKFTFWNVLMLIIATVAMCCQFLMPWLDVKINVTGEKLSPVLVETLGGEETEETKVVGEVLTTVLTDVKIQIPMRIYPLKMYIAASGDGGDLERFFNSVIGAEQAQKLVDDLSNQIAPALVTAALSIMVSEGDLTPEQIAQVEEYKEDVVDVLNNLNEGNTEEAKTVFTQTAQELATEYGVTLSEDDVSQLFDDFVEMGTKEDGSFDLTELLKNFDTSSLEGTGSGGVEPTGVLLTAASSGGDSQETDNPLTTVVELVDNPGHAIMTTLKDMGIEEADIHTALLFAFLLTTALPGFFWFLLALFCFIKLFTKRKSVSFWYVSVFCIWSGLGILLGKLAVKMVPKLLGGAGSPLATTLEAFSFQIFGSGVVTGICYVLLVVIYMLFYARIKKKIKRAKKNA